MNHCNPCPVSPELTCPGEGHRAFCADMAAGLPGRAAQLVALAEGRPLPGAVPARPATDLELRLAMAAELCPSGTGPCGCGGGPPRSCGREDRPAEVWRVNCIACVTVDWWQEGVEAGW
jgi:hypothetical protein